MVKKEKIAYTLLNIFISINISLRPTFMYVKELRNGKKKQKNSDFWLYLGCRKIKCMNVGRTLTDRIQTTGLKVFNNTSESNFYILVFPISEFRNGKKNSDFWRKNSGAKIFTKIHFLSST